MSRYKTFVATGVAPDGRIFAGDLNAIQDLKADVYDLTQNLGVNSLAVGETGLILSRFGVGEARVSGAFRADGIVRGLGGLMSAQLSTATMAALGAGLAPKSIMFYNSDLDQFQYNAGTDGARDFRAIGGSPSTANTYANRPAASTANAGQFFYATDKEVLYRSTGAAWVRIGSQAGDLFFTFNAAPSSGRVTLAGQTVSRTGLYDELFAKWGTTFGAGDGSTTFGLPDTRGRVLVAIGTHVDVDQFSDNDGLAVGSRSPKHNSSVVDPGHFHTTTVGATAGTGVGGPSSGVQGDQSANWNSNVKTTGITVGPGGSRPTDTPAYQVAALEAKL